MRHKAKGMWRILFWENSMRLAVGFALALLTSTSLASAQTAEQVKTDILSALATPLPITVIGPIIAQDVKITPKGQAFEAELVQPMLMGFVPLERMSFTLTPQGDKAYRVTDFKLPASIDVMNAATLKIGSTGFDGVWSTETRSYQTLNFKLNKVEVLPNGMPEAKVTLGSLALDVAKEGEAGAAQSAFAITAQDISSQGLPPNNIDVKSLVAELKADGETPVDLYSVVSRFAFLSLMQNDSNSLLQFAESLRTQSYDAVTLNVAASGIGVTGAIPGSNTRFSIAEASAVAGLTGVTPAEWQSVTFTVDTKGLSDNGVFDAVEMKADTGVFSIDGSRIPIGATLAAIGKLQSASNGEQVAFKVSELLDGLLDMGAIKVTSSASGIMYLPKDEERASVRFDKFSLSSGTEGFRDNKGRIYFGSSVEGMNVLIKSFPMAIQAKAYALFNPKLIRYDVSISELNEALLRKLFADVTIRSEDDLAGLAVPAATYAMALKPMIETKDMRFQSAQVDLSSKGSLRFYPAWALGALPYEGDTQYRVMGLDKIEAFVTELKTTPSDQGGVMPNDLAGISLLQSVFGTFKALATEDNGAQVWNVKFPEAGKALLVVNGTELRFPDLSALMGPLMGYGVMDAILNRPSDFVPAPDAMPQDAPVEAVPIPAPPVDAPVEPPAAQ
jgi:hypothetical protein